MPFQLAISGSTILSESNRLHELFAWGCEAIEIGSFADAQAYCYVLQECRRRQMQLGIHSPFYRDGDRYGLLLGEPLAYAELERDLLVAKRDGLSYVLVHFPYLHAAPQPETITQIQMAAKRIAEISLSHGIPVLLEPKLGPDRSPEALMLMHQLPLAELGGWGLPLCLDVGDIYLASTRLGLPYLQMVEHFAPLTHAVHLHNVAFGTTNALGNRLPPSAKPENSTESSQYIWTPITANNSVPIAETLALLKGYNRTITLVLEHTPHLVESDAQVRSGIDWLRGQLADSTEQRLRCLTN